MSHSIILFKFLKGDQIMKKVLIFFLLCSINIQGILPSKPWTIFNYFAGHNDLCSNVLTNLNQLPAGSNNNVNIISSFNSYASCLTTGQCTPTTTQRYQTVNKKNTQIGSTITNTNTGLGSFLVSELTFALQQAPSNSLAIFLGGHGLGPANGLCLDQNSGAALLNDVDIQNALKQAIAIRGKKTDVLAVDCCYMATIEYYSAWANYVNFIVASEEEDPCDGFPYNSIIGSLKNNINPKKFAQTIVTQFNKVYSSIGTGTGFGFTLAAVDATKIIPICKNIDSVALTLINLLKSSKKAKTFNAIRNSLNLVTTFKISFIDLQNLYIHLLSNTKGAEFKHLSSQLNAGLKLIKQAVIQNGTSIPGASGIYIFAPIKGPPQSCCKDQYVQTLFNTNFPNWLKFLNTFQAG